MENALHKFRKQEFFKMVNNIEEIFNNFLHEADQLQIKD